MPSFYPPNPNAFTSHGVGHGNGYKDACYQDMNDFSQQYPDFQHHDIHPQGLGPVLPNPFDRFAKIPTVYPPSQIYGYTYAANAHQSGMGAPAMNLAMPAVGHYYHDQANDDSLRQNAAIGDHAQAQATEEKHVGGVSATLDYDMETMTDFVAETAFGIYELCASRICIADIDLLRSIRPGFGLPSSFRKWVLQVLHATRLPTATILLSLAYLAQRARQLTAAGVFDPSEIALYRSLTVSLILGSKFLDDNTFQNKSWAEVSNIPVVDLNKDEREWLMAFHHRLHQSPDCFDGFTSCEQLWTAFKSRKPSLTVSTGPAPSVLQPIDTNIRSKQSSLRRQSPNNYRQQYLGKPGLSSFAVDPTLADPHYPAFLYPSMDVVHSHSASPASAQTTGPHTPEYYGGQMGWGVSEPYHRSDLAYYQPDAYLATRMPYSKYGRSQGYGYGHGPIVQGQTYWNCHGVACQCSTCRQSHFAPRYGPAVAG